MSPSNNSLDNATVPGLIRRLAAMFYDLWLLFALWLLGSTADTFIRQALYADSNTGNPLLLQIYLALVPFVFFAWFWTHGGQTLGMRSWRIKVLDKQGNALTLQLALKRLLWACISLLPLGMGYVWMLFDRDQLAWHDHLSGTRLVMLEKNQTA